MYLQDFGAAQIAVALEEDRVLTPVHYAASKGIKNQANMQLKIHMLGVIQQF